MQRGSFELSLMPVLPTLILIVVLNSTLLTMLLSQAIFGPTLFGTSHFFEHGKFALASSPTE
jgi:hypothetical protein